MWNSSGVCNKEIFTSLLSFQRIQDLLLHYCFRLSNRLSFLIKRQTKKRDSIETIPFKLISSYGGYILDEYEAYVTTKDCIMQILSTVYPQIFIPTLFLYSQHQQR